MTQHPYRNVVNGRVGYLSDEQAEVFPELLERVSPEDEARLIPEEDYFVLPAIAAPVVAAPKATAPAAAADPKGQK